MLFWLLMIIVPFVVIMYTLRYYVLESRDKMYKKYGKDKVRQVIKSTKKSTRIPPIFILFFVPFVNIIAFVSLLTASESIEDALIQSIESNIEGGDKK